MDDAALDHQAEEPDDDEGDRYGDEGIAAELADHRGGIGADHDHLAMGHVDDPGDAEDYRETESCNHQDRDHAEAAEKLGNDRLKHPRLPEGLTSLLVIRALAEAPLAPPQKSSILRSYRSIVPDRFFSSLHGFLRRSSTRLSVKSQVLFG